jgi:hypothetical protein
MQGEHLFRAPGKTRGLEIRMLLCYLVSGEMKLVNEHRSELTLTQDNRRNQGNSNEPRALRGFT